MIEKLKNKIDCIANVLLENELKGLNKIEHEYTGIFELDNIRDGKICLYYIDKFGEYSASVKKFVLLQYLVLTKDEIIKKERESAFKKD